jgi:hypothetical protein
MNASDDDRSNKVERIPAFLGCLCNFSICICLNVVTDEQQRDGRVASHCVTWF